MRNAALIAVSAMAFAAVPANAATIVNGSFENSSPNGSYETLNGSGLPGWSVGGTVDLIGSYWDAQEGSNSLDLNGFFNGEPYSISQNITGLTAGTTYVLSFFISGNPDTQATKEATLTLGGSTFPVSYTMNVANSPSNMQWQSVSYSFEAVDSSALLSLAGASANGPWGLAVDNFTISAAPEPASWLMMILGFGLVGGALRRRRGMGTLAAA